MSCSLSRCAPLRSVGAMVSKFKVSSISQRNWSDANKTLCRLQHAPRRSGRKPPIPARTRFTGKAPPGCIVCMSVPVRSSTLGPLQDRSARWDLNLPIRLFSTEGMVGGHCINVSESGLLGTFDRPVTVWVTGELTAFVGDRSISIRVRVVRLDGRDVALTFHPTGDEDRLAIRRLLQFADEHGQPKAQKLS